MLSVCNDDDNNGYYDYDEIKNPIGAIYVVYEFFPDYIDFSFSFANLIRILMVKVFFPFDLFPSFTFVPPPVWMHIQEYPHTLLFMCVSNGASSKKGHFPG